jgi:hypothetical protein
VEASTFIDNIVPGVTGNFSKTRIVATDTFGSLKIGSGLYANIVEVATDYSVRFDDHTVLVSNRGSTITLPDYANSKGRLIYVSNISHGRISVAGTIRDSDHFDIQHGNTVLFQNDGVQWNVLS